MSVHAKGIDGGARACKKALERISYVNRYSKMPGESVAGTFGNDAHGGRCVYEGAGHFIHGSVAAYCDDLFKPGSHRLRGEARSMARPLGIFENAFSVAFAACLDDG